MSEHVRRSEFKGRFGEASRASFAEYAARALVLDPSLNNIKIMHAYRSSPERERLLSQWGNIAKRLGFENDVPKGSVGQQGGSGDLEDR